MGFSPLATGKRIPDGGRSNPRNSRISGFTIHHQAGVDQMGEASNPNRQVSANYWIGNDGTIYPNIDETRRAWTTGANGYPAGAASDHRNITVEVSNSPAGVKARSWAISPAARRSLELLIGDVFKRHHLGPVVRATHGGVAVHQDFVPTACPGAYIMNNLNSIIAAAEKARSGSSHTGGDELRAKLHLEDAKSKAKGNRPVAPGTGFYLHTSPTAKTSNAANVAGPVGDYLFTMHLYAKGTPGDQVFFKYIWQTDPKGKPVNSGHYLQSYTIPESGELHENVSFQRYVGGSKPVAVYAHLSTPKTNKSPVVVTRFDSDAYVW